MKLFPRQKKQSGLRKNAVSVESYEKQLYDLRQLVEISKSLGSILDYSMLIESILYICLGQMHTLGAGMFIMKTFDADAFEMENNFSGLDLCSGIKYEIPVSHPIVAFLNENVRAYSLPELKEAFGAELPEQFTSVNPSLIVPLKQKTHLNGILVLGERIDVGDGVEYTEYDRFQIMIIASLVAIAINNAALIDQATTDMMTHLKLKYYFYSYLSGKLEFSHQNKLPLSVMMLDIDFFKKFNDMYGHACGDYVLQQVAKVISDGIRGQDLAGRYGGEEFVVMLYNTDGAGAMLVAERIRQDIEQMDLVYENDTHLHVTISIGVAEFLPETEVSSKELIELADQALYVSKRSGRNRVTLANPNELRGKEKNSDQ